MHLYFIKFLGTLMAFIFMVIPWGQIALFYPQILSEWPDIYVD